MTRAGKGRLGLGVNSVLVVPERNPSETNHGVAKLCYRPVPWRSGAAEFFERTKRR